MAATRTTASKRVLTLVAHGTIGPRARPAARTQDSQARVVHGDRREDNYFWLRDKDDPRVTAYLEAENAYTAAVMQPMEAFQDALYREILGRIKEDDATVPYRRGNHFYYSRTEKGKQYPIHCRKAAGRMSRGDPARSQRPGRGPSLPRLGAYAVNDDADRLAYTLDYTGFREYTLFVKHLTTGELEPDRIEKVSTVAWSARPGTLLYVSEDAAKRPYRLWRHRLGDASDDLIFEEADELFRVHVWRSRSRAWLFAASRSFTSSEVRYVPATDPAGAWRTVLEREKDHEYDVDHGVGPGTASSTSGPTARAGATSVWCARRSPIHGPSTGPSSSRTART